MNDAIRSGMMFIVFCALTMSYVLYSPEGEPQRLRAFNGTFCAVMSGFWMLTCIRFIIREELERKESPHHEQ